MIASLYKISRVLLPSSPKERANADIATMSSLNEGIVSIIMQRNLSIENGILKLKQRNLAVIKLIEVVTMSFFVLWTPFICLRLIKYSGVEVDEMLWRGCQLLIFSTTAVNFIIYSFMSPMFREAFKTILKTICNCHVSV